MSIPEDYSGGSIRSSGLGFKTILDVPHLPAIGTGLRSRDFLDKAWLQWTALPRHTPGALLKLLFSSHRNLIFEGVLPRFALSGFAFAQPFLLTRVVSYATASPDARLEKQLGWRNSSETALSEPPPSLTSVWPSLMLTLSTKHTASSPSCEVPWSLSSTPRL